MSSDQNPTAGTTPPADGPHQGPAGTAKDPTTKDATAEDPTAKDATTNDPTVGAGPGILGATRAERAAAVRRRQPGHTPSPIVPRAAVEAFRVRFLDPTKSALLPSGEPPQATAYVGDSLLLSATPSATDDLLGAVHEAADRLGARAILHPGHAAQSRLDPDAGQRHRTLFATLADGVGRTLAEGMADAVPGGLTAIQTLDAGWTARVRFLPKVDSAGPPVDAWRVLLESLNNGVPTQAVGLDHVLLAAPTYWIPMPYGSGAGPAPTTPSSEYARPGLGGLMPVSLVLADPARRTRADIPRAPRVALLDTGLGAHPWFPEGGTANRLVRACGYTLGLDGDVPGCAVPRAVAEALDAGLPSNAGHGTFMAGLIRQTCPEARIDAVRVMTDTGVATEATIVRTLLLLLLDHLAAMRDGRAADLLDVVCLSLGFYGEDIELVERSPLAAVIGALGAAGVAVVGAAGNDATSAPFFPAAFSVLGVAHEREVVPVCAVGATNPDGASTAYFSNDGDWLTCSRPGAAVVSTIPVDLIGPSQASASRRTAFDVRATLDPDDFAGGFGVWSGTSFAAPVLAGQIAARIVEHPLAADPGLEAAVRRGQDCVASAVADGGPR